jgi:energy-coupling factor transporter ATP-binding protein EcfA2
MIIHFPLGQFDIASIFTLPNNGCFGRQKELAIINTIIRRTAYMCGLNVRRRRLSSSGVTAAAAAVLSPLKLSNNDGQHLSPPYQRHNKNDTERHHSKLHRNRKRPTEIIAIYGNTGVGKSTLVRNVQEFAREYGYIAIAKFDTRQPTPYGCILRCLSIFLKNILAEPASEIERFRRMLKDQLGAETISQLPTLLVDNVPELASFLDQPSLQRASSSNSATGCECDMEGGEIKLRFHSALIEIFEVMVNFKFVTLVSSIFFFLFSTQYLCHIIVSRRSTPSRYAQSELFSVLCY